MLSDCSQVEVGRPDRSTRSNNKSIGESVWWAWRHIYLSMGILKNLEEIDTSLVVAGNPFTRCTIVNQNSGLLQIDFPRQPC